MSIEIISEKHQRIAGLLIYSLKVNHTGCDRKIKSDEILFNLRARTYKIGDAELREIIGHIRRNDLCSPGFILSDNGGYWYSEELEEMLPVAETEYGRALKVLQNFRPLRRRIKHLQAQKNAFL